MVSTVLFVSGVTTLLHTSFGSRLPLIQGPSFVFLAPALAIINSPEFQGLNGNVCFSFALFFFSFFVAVWIMNISNSCILCHGSVCQKNELYLSFAFYSFILLHGT